jgi:5-methylcytosine-specific restriction endonuclease McrA
MQSCLLLNASYEPLSMLPHADAVRLLYQGKAELVEGDHARPVRSVSQTMPYPLVIKLVKLVKVPRKFRRKVSNTFLFARDSYSCQYCGRHENELRRSEGLTRDHIQPISKGGTNEWTNCVTACSSCNWRKANRTPEQAGMKLRTVPTEPNLVVLRWNLRKVTELQRRYVKMFFGEDV